MGYFIDHLDTDTHTDVPTLADAVALLRELHVPESQVRTIAATPVDVYIGHELELDNGGFVAIEGCEEPGYVITTVTPTDSRQHVVRTLEQARRYVQPRSYRDWRGTCEAITAEGGSINRGDGTTITVRVAS